MRISTSMKRITIQGQSGTSLRYGKVELRILFIVNFPATLRFNRDAPTV